MNKNKNIEKLESNIEKMTDEQKQKYKDYRREYYKKYYAAKKLNNNKIIDDNDNDNKIIDDNDIKLLMIMIMIFITSQ